MHRLPLIRATYCVGLLLLALAPVRAAELQVHPDTALQADSPLQQAEAPSETPVSGFLPERGPGTPPVRVPPELPWGRVIWGLGVVVMLILGGVWLLKKLNGGLPIGRGRYMKLLEAMPVGGKVQLFLVQVGEKVVMMAATEGNVSRVAEFPAEELPEVEPPSQADPLEGFKSIMRRVSGSGAQR